MLRISQGRPTSARFQPKKPETLPEICTRAGRRRVGDGDDSNIGFSQAEERASAQGEVLSRSAPAYPCTQHALHKVRPDARLRILRAPARVQYCFFFLGLLFFFSPECMSRAATLTGGGTREPRA